MALNYIPLRSDTLSEIDEQLLEAFRRFGIELELFFEYYLLYSPRNIYLLKAPEEVEPLLEILLTNPNKISYYGLPAFQRTPLGWKPSTRFAQSFGHFFKRNYVKLLSKDLLRRFVESYPIDLTGSSEVQSSQLEDGWVVALWEKWVIGVGTYKSGIIRGHIPKTWKKELLSFL